MSADNTILIVRFSNKKWRMKEVQAVENLYFSFRNTTGLNPARLYEMMKDAKSYKSKHLAYDDAEKIFEEIYIEYGIQPIKVDYTWEQLLHLAHDELMKEIEYIQLESHQIQSYCDDIEELTKTKIEIEEILSKKRG